MNMKSRRSGTGQNDGKTSMQRIVGGGGDTTAVRVREGSHQAREKRGGGPMFMTAQRGDTGHGRTTMVQRERGDQVQRTVGEMGGGRGEKAMIEVTENVNTTWRTRTEIGTAVRTGMRGKKGEMKAVTRRRRRNMRGMIGSIRRGRRKRIGKRDGHKEKTEEEVMVVTAEREVDGEKREGTGTAIVIEKGTIEKTTILRVVMGNGGGKRTDIIETVHCLSKANRKGMVIHSCLPFSSLFYFF